MISVLRNRKGINYMREKILDKLNNEYELFFLKTMSSTKESIFSHSYEIEMKKNITSFLKNEITKNKKITLLKMETSNGIIEEFYRYVTDHKEISFEKAMKEYLKNYLD